MVNAKNVWIRIAAALVTYILVLLIICHFLPFSKLFLLTHQYDDLFKQVESATDLRTKQAKQYFETLSPDKSKQQYNDRVKQPNFVLGLVTVQRIKGNPAHDSYGYLLQSTSQLDNILKNHAFFNNSILFICNVDPTPEKHLDAVGLYPFVPYIERYGQNSLGLGQISIPGTTNNFSEKILHSSKYHKETFDYAFCLLSAAALNPEYIILIEDDSLVHKDMPSVLENIMETRLKLIHDRAARAIKFAYLKLFYPAKWQGFGFECRTLPDLISLSVVGGLLFHIIWMYVAARNVHLSFNITRVFLFGCILTLVSCWLIGRQNVNELRRAFKYLYRLQSSEGCCTQAMLYPVDVVDSLSRHLVSSIANKHTDLAILDFSKSYSLPTYQVEPSLFLHVGLHTSLSSDQKHPEEFLYYI